MRLLTILVFENQSKAINRKNTTVKLFDLRTCATTVQYSVVPSAVQCRTPYSTALTITQYHNTEQYRTCYSNTIISFMSSERLHGHVDHIRKQGGNIVSPRAR